MDIALAIFVVCALIGFSVYILAPAPAKKCTGKPATRQLSARSWRDDWQADQVIDVGDTHRSAPARKPAQQPAQPIRHADPPRAVPSQAAPVSHQPEQPTEFQLPQWVTDAMTAPPDPETRARIDRMHHAAEWLESLEIDETGPQQRGDRFADDIETKIRGDKPGARRPRP